MKIVRFETEPRADRPATHLNPIGPGWNAYTDPSAGKLSAHAQLAGHLLLGRERLHDTAWLSGELQIDSGRGEEYLLRREGAHNDGRMVVLQIDSEAIETPVASLEAWRAGLPARELASLFYPVAHSGEDDGLDELLSAPLAEAINRLRTEPTQPGRYAQPSVGFKGHNDLLRRRDLLIAKIESFLGERRGESQSLESRLATLDDRRQSLASQINDLRELLHRVDAELGEAETRSRYHELSLLADEAENVRLTEGWSQRLEELDAQIAKWRVTLEELESRAAYLRSRLAQWRPDDASPEVALADQRAGLAVAQRLMVDLESEVARFARSGDTPHVVFADAHARMNPLVETLGRHLRRVTELVEQQDHALLGRTLHHEAEQVDRSVAEVRRQVDALLDQRQTLLNSGRAKDPRRGEFDVETLDVADLAELERRRAAAAEELNELQLEANRLDAEHEQLHAKRARLLDSSQLREWQSELDAVQAQLGTAGEKVVEGSRSPLKASTLLAQLSDGELVGLRLAQGGRDCEVTRRGGQSVTRKDLTFEEQRLVAWALRLALIDLCSLAGVSMPIVLDEPFAKLSDRHTANLVTMMDDLRRLGRQVLLFTQRESAISRLRSLGVSVRRLEAAPAPEPRVKKTKQVVIEESGEPVCLLNVSDPVEKFPVPITRRAELFARARVRTIGDLIAADPSAVAEELDTPEVCPELVSLWQTHLALVCFVPGLGLGDAKALAEAEIFCAEDLAESDAESLVEQLVEFGRETTLEAVEGWIELAADSLPQWSESEIAKAWRRNLQERQERIAENESRRPVA